MDRLATVELQRFTLMPRKPNDRGEITAGTVLAAALVEPRQEDRRAAVVSASGQPASYHAVRPARRPSERRGGRHDRRRLGARHYIAAVLCLHHHPGQQLTIPGDLVLERLCNFGGEDSGGQIPVFPLGH